MKNGLLKFALGSLYVPGKEECLGTVLFLFLCEVVKWFVVTTSWIVLFLVFGVGQWLLCTAIMFPAGRYVRFKKDENPRIPFWPKIFGRNVWLYVVVAVAIWGHYVWPMIAWYPAVFLGVGFAIAIPFLWHILTIPVRVEEPEQ